MVVPRILIVNLMPNQFETELQFKHHFKTAMIDFLYLETHQTNTEKRNYAKQHYINFEQAQLYDYDALIVTGAPVEHLPFASVYYYEELKSIIDWSKAQQHTRLFICWAAQFALHHYYNIEKFTFKGNKKLFGVYAYNVLVDHPLTNNFQSYYIPQSRYTNFVIQDIKDKTDLTIISTHPEFGADLLISKDNKDIYINGHLEYAPNTLHTEYIRDCKKGLTISFLENYYAHDNSSDLVIQRWKPFADSFFNAFVTILSTDKSK
ncbi:homoserine O-succinyltransferase [Macrococcus epidermidis]|uniref:homoserine O-acetyltransferase/O-succinyltransferase family protein n=1 Tax=Macrococcus epidermidis TaxID=1902580 RepID=UPI001EF3A875|nr:homoserine O-succinyltransferase [Macrococcus epidermidis]MCG7419112.1 homoserine O-succinyltransferase [Macrococcus epidermidis]